ncbi:MAG: AraC family transcriptional regulator ligand-binding domain-containing protein [Pseudomonadota bacterium]|nr:AraC family transcriptional regulator ligand-binding domain-containing protein [Pseudomonadota bacterium]
MFDAASVMGRLSHLVAKFCAEHQLDPPPTCQQYWGQERIPLAVFEDMLDEVYQQRPVIGLGIQIGQMAQIDDVGVIGYLGLSCQNAWEMLLRFMRYHRVAYDVNDMQTNFTDDAIEMTWGTEHHMPSRLLDETLLSLFLAVIRQLIGMPHLKAVGVGLLYPDPLDSSRYEDFFGCPVQFNSDFTRLQLPISVLSAPIIRSDPTLTLRVEQQVEAMLAALPQQDHLEAELRQRLVECIHNGETSLSQVAQRMHLSTHTLQRRLAERQQSFDELLLRTRRKLAEQYLNDSTLGLADIAFLLGYVDLAALQHDLGTWLDHQLSRIRPAQMALIPST